MLTWRTIYIRENVAKQKKAAGNMSLKLEMATSNLITDEQLETSE